MQKNARLWFKRLKLLKIGTSLKILISWIDLFPNKLEQTLQMLVLMGVCQKMVKCKISPFVWKTSKNIFYKKVRLVSICRQNKHLSLGIFPFVDFPFALMLIWTRMKTAIGARKRQRFHKVFTKFNFLTLYNILIWRRHHLAIFDQLFGLDIVQWTICAI